jgi:hypothetical protein
VRTGAATGPVVTGKYVVFGRTGTVVVAGIIVVIVTGTVVLVYTGWVGVGIGVGDSVVFDTEMFIVAFIVIFGTTSPDITPRERKTRLARSTADIRIKCLFLPRYVRIKEILHLFLYSFGLNAIKILEPGRYRPGT